MKILIETIPHSEQRYPTVGDWFWKSSRTKDFDDKGKGPDWHEKDTLVIRVSAMSDWRYEVLVGLHEAIEALLCKHAGVSEAIVDAFDLNFKGEGEPGDDIGAPYHRQHEMATYVEQFLASGLDVDWPAHELEIDSL
jgi:hypothetical protein